MSVRIIVETKDTEHYTELLVKATSIVREALRENNLYNGNQKGEPIMSLTGKAYRYVFDINESSKPMETKNEAT